MMKTYKDLEVWKLSMDLVTDIYEETARLPDSEKFGLFRQMRDACISVPSNISEGSARQTRKEFIYFLYISSGSLAELECQILICAKLKYFPASGEIMNKIIRIKAMIRKLVVSLKKTNSQS